MAPDEIISAMTKEWLKKQSEEGNPIILDGYPRTIKQAKSLVAMLKENKFQNFNLHVIRFTIAEQVIVDRIANRVVCENKKCQQVYSLKTKKPKQEGICDLCGSRLSKRSDDNEEVIRSRYQTYMANEKDILNFFVANTSK